MKKKLIYAILAVIVSILVLVVPAIHPAGRVVCKKRVNKVAMCAMRDYLALNPATVSVQELEHKRQAAYNAAATMPNRLRIKHQAHIVQKNEQSSYKDVTQLAARTGQTADQLRTEVGHAVAQKNIEQLLTTIAKENNGIVKQIKDKQYDQISFASVLAQVEEAATAIHAFGRVYNNDAAYDALTMRLEAALKPALVKNGLTFITHELKSACPEVTAQMKPLSVLATTIRPHAIERLKASGVLAIANIINRADESRYGNALLQARMASTQLYETLNTITSKLGTSGEQASEELTPQYQQAYQSYVNTIQEFINAVAVPLRLIYQDASQQTVIHADTLKQRIAHQRNQMRAITRKPKSVEQPMVPQQDVISEDQEDDKEDAQPAHSTVKRDLIGAAGALGLVLLYEFVIAPKMGTKKLGIAEFCKAAMNKQNPLTVKLDGQPAAGTNDDKQEQDGPGFLKRFGFDILCGFFGL